MDRTRTLGMMSLEEYLSFEARSSSRHEYVAGEVYAMTGASTRHNLITLNIVSHLRDAARARGCRVFATDVKLRLADDRIYYPDVMVACGAATHVEMIVEAPSLIAEVTSRATRATDRREKLDAYRRMPSLLLYLIVDQRRRHVLVYRRAADGGWERNEVEADGQIPIAFLDARITLDQIYYDLTLPPLAVGEGDEWEGDEEG
jgi:Uma2 family endonuclease